MNVSAILRPLVPLIIAAACAAGGDHLSPEAARKAIAEAADGVGTFDRLLPALSAKDQVRALGVIRQRRLEAASSAVAGVLRAPQPAAAEVQVAALRALSVLGDPTDDALDAVHGMVQAKDNLVRSEAFACAVVFRDRSAIPLIAEALATPTLARDAHAALVRLAGGTDIGIDAGDWKSWYEKKTAGSAAGLADLRRKLGSSDPAVVVAALPGLAIIDVDVATKRKLVAPLVDGADPVVAKAASSVMAAITGGPSAFPERAAAPPEAAVIPPPVAVAAAAVRGPLSEHLSTLLFLALLAALVGALALFMFLMRTREPAIRLVKHATQRIGRGVMYATRAIKKKITFTS